MVLELKDHFFHLRKIAINKTANLLCISKLFQQIHFSGRICFQIEVEKTHAFQCNGPSHCQHVTQRPFFPEIKRSKQQISLIVCIVVSPGQHCSEFPCFAFPCSKLRMSKISFNCILYLFFRLLISSLRGSWAFLIIFSSALTRCKIRSGLLGIQIITPFS
jgi:hypothetical protein